MTQPLRLEYVDPSTLSGNPANWRTHGPGQVAKMGGLLAEVGWAGALLYNERTGRLIDGHMRLKLAVANRLDAVPVLIGTWDEAGERKILATLDNVGTLAGIDTAAFDALLRTLDVADAEVQALLAEAAEDFGIIPSIAEVNRLLKADDGGDEQDDPDPTPRPPSMAVASPAEAEDGPIPPTQEAVDTSVPDIVFPSDNEYDIPTLDLSMQADCPDNPWKIWGSQGHGKPMPGTFFCYTDDKRFNSLWGDPGVVLKSGCRNFSETNFTLRAQTPLYEAIYRTAKKRWISRFLQMRGVRILVDLNVPERFSELNLKGVPRGWKAYSTRSHQNGQGLFDEHARAVEHAGTDKICFAVYGGSKAIKTLCAERSWYWIPEDSDVARGRVNADGS